jgi:hypothetical protein
MHTGEWTNPDSPTSPNPWKDPPAPSATITAANPAPSATTLTTDLSSSLMKEKISSSGFRYTGEWTNPDKVSSPNAWDDHPRPEDAVPPEAPPEAPAPVAPKHPPIRKREEAPEPESKGSGIVPVWPTD